MRILFFLLLIGIPITLFGQIFPNKEGEQVAADWVFNADFIRANHIKSINGRFTFKFKGVPMRETNYWQVFEFDTLGRIHRSYETRKDDGTRDTVWTHYFYNDKGWLIYKSVGNEENLTYLTTVYDQDHRITSLEEFQRRQDSQGILSTKEKSKESYTYEVKDGKTIKTKINGFGSPISKETYFYDTKGKINRTEDRYISTKEGIITQFTFDAQGNLLLKKTETSKQGIEKEKIQFSYDAGGNLMEKKVSVEGTLKLETQFIYNEKTGFLSAILMEENSSSNIIILRIKEYEYY
ncbi:MAG: hypothetical protein WC044_01820 [Crocinitomicaceae bacterium]